MPYKNIQRSEFLPLKSQMINYKGRIVVFDVIKLFAIFLVIWGHVILHLQNYEFNQWENPIYRFISSFHMPLFMMISGFFCANANVEFKSYIGKKFRQLILPSLAFGIIFSISWHFVSGGGGLKSYVLCYWFLKSLFFCSILFYIAEKFKFKWIGYVLTILFSSFIYFYQINWMFTSFLVGVQLFRHKEYIIKNLIPIMASSGFIFFSMFINWNLEMASMPWFKLYKYINPQSISDISFPLFCFVYKVILGISGSIFVITLFLLIGKYLPSNNFGNICAKWGTMTLGIYLWQAIVLEHIMMKTIDLSRMDWYVFNYGVTPLLSLFVLVICVLLTKLLKRNNWTNFIFLGAPVPNKYQHV